MRADLDDAEFRLAKFLSREPIQQLDQLQLVIEVMLEPQHYFFMPPKVCERLIATLKLSMYEFIVAPSKRCQRPRAHVRELRQAQTAGDLAVVQHIIPRKVFA